MHFQAKTNPKMAAEPNNKMADPSRKEESEFRKSVLVTLSFIYEESNPFLKILMSYLLDELLLPALK